MNVNPFIRPVESYTRDLNVVRNLLDDMTLMLQRSTGDSYEECRAFAKELTGPGGEYELKDPTVTCLTRGKNQDRKVEEIPYTQYLKDIVTTNRLFSPAMTVYEHPNVKRSVLADYIEGNIAGRDKVKTEEKEAEMAGDFELMSQKSNEQTTYKTSNNSLSGGQASPHTILFNKTAHSSLTSTCRCATSYGNANNEKFLTGNRHYWSLDVVLANMVSVIAHVDLKLLQQAVTTYGLHYPTADDVVECVDWSTQLYLPTKTHLAEVRRLAEGFTPLERAAFVYAGDMHHLAKHNPKPVRQFLKELSTKSISPVDNPDEIVGSMDNDLKAFVSLLCAKELNGLTIKKLREVDFDKYVILASTAKSTRETLQKYRLLIEALWVTDTVPASVAHIRNSVRRTAVTSDTDSTIFTVQDWVQWYCGHMGFDEEANAIDYTMVYLASQSIIHVLAKMSAQLGVTADKLFRLAMKNEYAFPVFSLTPMAKHYYAYQAAREGNVKKVMEAEIKGVYLKDSNCPPEIMKQVTGMITWIMDQVLAGTKISIEEVYRKIAKVEGEIYQSVVDGSASFLAGAPVNSRESYSSKGSTPYTHYELWQEVFAPSYGDAPPPPYRAIRVSLDINNRTDMNQWLEGMSDKGLAGRFRQWVTKRVASGAVATILLPVPIVEVSGVPKEIIDAMNVRKLIYSTVRPFYLVLESLGIYMVNKHNTHLVSDYVKTDHRIG